MTQVASSDLAQEKEEVQKKLAGNQDHPILNEECPNWIKISGRVYDDYKSAEAALR